MKPRFFLFALSAGLLLGLAPANPLRAADPEDDAPSADAPSAGPLHALHPARHHSSSDDDQVGVLGDANVPEGQTVQSAVAVMGGVNVDGHCLQDAVAVMGSNTINGTVDGDAVCVMGDLTLGPKAHVGHDVTCVMGSLHRDPGAFIGGSVVQEGGFGNHVHFKNAFTRLFWTDAMRHGRMISVGPDSIFMWVVNGLVLGVYALLALLFPAAMRRTGDMLILRPIQVLLSGFLALIALPVLFVLLLVTVIGIPVALVLLPISIVLMLFFGKAAFYGLIGRKISGEKLPLPAAVLVGGVLMLCLMLFPYVSILVYLVIAYLGFGCALTALITVRRGPAVLVPPVQPVSAPQPVPPVAPPPSAPPAAPWAAPVYPSPLVAAEAPPPAAAAPVAPPPTAFGDLPPPVPPPPPPAPVAPVPPVMPLRVPPPALPVDLTNRASFWIRTGAMAIDCVVWAALTLILHAHETFYFLGLAVYAAVMWKLRGATLGGLICHLHVVRLDGRPIDWPTAIVRSLGCFVSLCAAGLGFIWVAIDPERQSWHDKLAGTTVVISVTRRSLV